jgi:antagonist of KipI
VIRYFEAHEYHSFSRHAQLLIETAAFRLSAQSGRMAYRFRGSPLYQENPLQLVSTAVVPGTMQVTPDGQLMILMADAQTTGGYPRIGQVCRVDLSLLAQQLPGTSLHFRKVSVEEAESLYLNRQKQLIALRKDYQLFFR